MRNNEESRKTENIGQTMKNYDARRKTHEKNQITGGFRKKERHFILQKNGHRKI